MNNQALQLANSISNNEEINFIFYIILLCIVIIGSYLGNYLGEYAKNRAKQYATKADLDEILEQLKISTEITAKVKAEIEHGAWRTKELENLKREKLEQYLICHYEAIESFTKKMQRDFFYNEVPFDDSCFAKLSMIQNLYLPEIDNEHKQYLKVSAKFFLWLANGQTELAEKMRKGENKPVISQEHMSNYKTLLSELNATTLIIESKMKEIGRNINVA